MMTNMKLIGLLGGMSWESTVEYYKIMNIEVQKRLGGHKSAEVLIYSLNFEEIKDLHFKGDWDGVTGMLTERALKWDDPKANIYWPIKNPILSLKDSNTKYL